MIDILNIVLPAFIIIFIGYIFGRTTKMNISPVIAVTLYVGVPALVITSMLDKNIVLIDAGKVWASACIVTFGCGIAGWIVFKIIKQKHRGLYLPISIMNSVNIPFPIIYLAYGSEGLLAATLFFIPSTLVLFSLGIYIVAGKRWKESIKEVFKVPLFYAALIGLLLNLFHVALPEIVISPLELLGTMSVPLMLLILGYNLSNAMITSLTTTLLAAFLRIGVGFLLGFLAVSILDIAGIFRSVVILDSIMPAAVITSLLAAKYENEAELVASVVFVTTVISLVTIPFVLNMLL